MANVPETLLRHRLFIAVLIILASGAAGCISQQPEILKVNPLIDYNPLEGFHNKSEGMFIVINGSIPEVKESLKDIIIKKAAQTSTFSANDELNFVVFRGVFGTGGYGINIDKVERKEGAFTVHATYRDPGKGVGVTEAVTQPVAIILIGKLHTGNYEARLRVTRVEEETDNSGTKLIRKIVEPEKELSTFNFKVQPPEERIERKASIPNAIIIVDSYSPPAYKGSSTLVALEIGGNNVTKGTEISLNYKTQIWLANGSWEENPESVHLIPEQKPLVFKRTIKVVDAPEKLYSNLTINVDKKAVDGDYYVTVSGEGKGLTFESAVLSFKIGKGGKFPLPEKSVWNIGYSKNMPPPISDEERSEASAVIANASDLKDKMYEITGVDLSFREFKNFSGFFPVVTVDIGEPDEPGAIVSYIIDLEEKKVIGSTSIPRKPFPASKLPIAIVTVEPNSGDVGTKVVITGTGFTARDNNVALRLEPENSNGTFKIGYINNLKSYDGKTIEFVIPEVLSACAFPLPENAGGPITGCPAIGLTFKAGIQTCPLFIVNQNGMSNSVNFTVSRGLR